MVIPLCGDFTHVKLLHCAAAVQNRQKSPYVTGLVYNYGMTHRVEKTPQTNCSHFTVTPQYKRHIVRYDVLTTFYVESKYSKYAQKTTNSALCNDQTWVTTVTDIYQPAGTGFPSSPGSWVGTGRGTPSWRCRSWCSHSLDYDQLWYIQSPLDRACQDTQVLWTTGTTCNIVKFEKSVSLQ